MKIVIGRNKPNETPAMKMIYGTHEYIETVEEYKYLGITVEGRKHGGCKSMGDRMKEANGLMRMVKYAAERSGSKYVIGKEGWKTMILSKLMYGCGARAWYQRIWQMAMGSRKGME